MNIVTFDSSTNSADYIKIKESLAQGGLVVFPTDTVYGLACDATNKEAVDKLKAFKGQRGNKPISIAVRDQAMAEQYANLNVVAQNLYQQFLPGPLTIISSVVRRSSFELAKGISSLEGTVGIRIIPHPFVTELFKHIDFPITATSANISNNPNPRSLEQWLQDTPQKKQHMIDIFIDAGELPYAEPSTIIDTSKEDTEIVRQGTLELSHLVARRPSHVRSFTSHSPEETKDIAKQLASDLRTSNSKLRTKAIIIALQGPLGAGKTVFTQGLAHALGISEPLRSPTYTLVKEYKIHSSVIPHPSSRLFHIDAWRLSSPEEFQDLGLDNMLKPGNIIILEWPQRLRRLLKSLSLKSKLFVITITVIDDLTRKITYHHTT